MIMSSSVAMLHLLCGKIAAGKSTLATTIAQQPNTLLIGEDHWLSRLYPGEQNTLEDYVRNSGRLRDAMSSHLVELLRTGISVALDFPANTPKRRDWMRTLFEKAECSHTLHFLDVPDEVCLSRIRKRNEGGKHEFVVTDADFALFTSHFAPPTVGEGFVVRAYRS
jgi:predicted kinase